jgi:hypothetical protein
MAKIVKVAKTGWTLDEARALVNELQGRMWALRHHIALGGSVLNHGTSEKDLDLYVLPFGGDAIGTAEQVDDVLELVLDYESPIGGAHYPQQPSMRRRDRYTYGDKRVDVFVVKS